MLRNVRTCRYSQLLTALGLLLVLNLNLMGAFGRRPGKDRFIPLGARAMEMSASGRAVLALSVNPSQEGNDLDVYWGEGLVQKTRILENALAFGLGARGYQVGVASPKFHVWIRAVERTIKEHPVRICACPIQASEGRRATRQSPADSHDSVSPVRPPGGVWGETSCQTQDPIQSGCCRNSDWTHEGAWSDATGAARPR